MVQTKSRSASNIAELPREVDFSVVPALLAMQRGLPAVYDYSDFIYVTEAPKGAKKDVLSVLGKVVEETNAIKYEN